MSGSQIVLLVSNTAYQGYAPAPSVAPNTKKYSWIELAFVFGLLVLYTEGLIQRLLFVGGIDATSPILRFLWLPSYAAILLASVWQYKTVGAALLRQPFLVAITLMACLSFLWSIDPGTSQRRGLGLLMTSVGGVFVAMRYDWRTLLRLIGLSWFFVGFVGFLMGLVAPSIAIMNEVHIGAWQGLYYDKNLLGGQMSSATYVCAFLAFMDRPWRKFWCVATLICLLMLLLSTSKTALLGLLIGGGVMSTIIIMKKSVSVTFLFLWFGVFATSLFVGVFAYSPEIFFGLIGREVTLTGRTDIWGHVIAAIFDRPALGYGYGAFWEKLDGPVSWIHHTLEFDASHAHNGWLEVALATGFVGLTLLLTQYLISVWRAAFMAVHTWTGAFALGFFLQVLLFSMSESILLQQNSILWIAYVAISTKLAMRPRL